MPILPKERDPRLITVRRGGTLTDEHHVLLAEWAVLCAEHVLPLFEQEQPSDPRPREAINVGRAWIRGEVRVGDAHQVASPRMPQHVDWPGQRSSRRSQLGKRWRWLTSRLTTWAPRPTRSGQLALRPLLVKLRQHGCVNLDGRGIRSRSKCVTLSSTTSGAEARSAGTSSTTDGGHADTRT